MWECFKPGCRILHRVSIDPWQASSSGHGHDKQYNLRKQVRCTHSRRGGRGGKFDYLDQFDKYKNLMDSLGDTDFCCNNQDT